MNKKIKILLLYPRFPNTFWSFKYALPFIGKKSAFPPLGLLTLSAMLPEEWEKKLVDLNIGNLRAEDFAGVDYVFISAMIIQKDSVHEIIKLAKSFNKKIVAGGPLFTTGYEEFSNDVDCFVLGEAEAVVNSFAADLNAGNLKKIYKAVEFPDIRKTPIPMWKLIDMKKYASMCIQFSRGCPFDCEFCDIVLLNGRFPRSKDKEQVLLELSALYEAGWRGGVFFVDDNFIGNKIKLKKEILPAIIEWMEMKKNPFSFNTQVSINLADDKELMELMSKAGFNTVFIGIETPKEESLRGCGKFQNVNRNLLDSIRAIQNHGLQVQAGFIIGFDQDTPSIFDRMTLFIQTSGIATAMVGVLQALPKTKLWERLKKEKRLIAQPSGNTDATVNFRPNMNIDSLLSGYKKIVSQIYSPKYYYQRLLTFLKEYKPKQKKNKIRRFTFGEFLAFLKSVWVLGVKEKGRIYF